MHIYLYMHMYIYTCHQIDRIVNPSMNCTRWYMVFPVQHSYLDTSTSKADYIITFLGLWELCSARKTIHTSWPSFSLVSKMSEDRQAIFQQGKLRFKRIITEKHREINELLEQVKTRNITKAR